MARSSSGVFSRPLVRELDVSPAVLRRLAARFPERYPVLFDSAAEGPLSQASVLVAEPRAALWLDADGHLGAEGVVPRDRKSTRLNSSHLVISYAVFCLKKKK